MPRKGLTTTVQVSEYKKKSTKKYTTPIPMALINLLGIDKGDKLIWTLNKDMITLKVVKG
jgi:hypothetical protein